MKLTVLVDNNTFIDQYLIGEPGVSFFIEADGQRILFDAGYSDAFLNNAEKLGIDLTRLNWIVLSHGHLDHTWGLEHLIKFLTEKQSNSFEVEFPTLVAHQDVFLSRSLHSQPIGSLLNRDSIDGIFSLQLSKEPFQLTPRLWFLGEVERLNDFEAKCPIGMIQIGNGKEVPDFVMDDSALVYCADAGLVIITGCSHSGICNIVEQAKRITGESRILDIVGGFHLLAPSEVQMQGTLDYFRGNEPEHMHACHCTDLQSKVLLSVWRTCRKQVPGWY
jgi:7,8-dihydropterin-6-yl-methyl-4-(beta-D-ribofuranosyl)aminobenzene 5'-phosphate synthase